MKTSRSLAASGLVKVLAALATVAVLAGICFKLNITNHAQQAEIAALRAQAKEADQLQVELKELPKLRGQLRELESLRKDASELPRLRNEVSQLRGEKQQFAKAQSENAQLRAAIQQQQAQFDQGRAQQQQQFALAQLAARANDPALGRNGCIQNLKQIDGATQQWALENRKFATDPYALTDPKLLAYLRGSVLPTCPAGGLYSAGRNVAAVPTCSIPGHTL